MCLGQRCDWKDKLLWSFRGGAVREGEGGWIIGVAAFTRVDEGDEIGGFVAVGAGSGHEEGGYGLGYLEGVCGLEEFVAEVDACGDVDGVAVIGDDVAKGEV